MDKRSFLKQFAAAVALAPTLTARAVLGEGTDTDQDPIRRALSGTDFPMVLWLRRTGEMTMIDCSDRAGYEAVRWFLRDVEAGNVMGYPHLQMVRIACWMQAWLAAYGVHDCWDVLSGLRMPGTNAHVEGAAWNSKHLPDGVAEKQRVFRAMDVRSFQVRSEYLGRLAALAHAGGVGFYTHRDLTHIDSGRVRYWRHR